MGLQLGPGGRGARLRGPGLLVRALP
jgi:hypothetical protein